LGIARHEPVGVLLQVTGAGLISLTNVGAYPGAFSISAFAVVGNTPVDLVIAHRLLRFSRPDVPERILH
jgi:hypothetical protein